MNRNDITSSSVETEKATYDHWNAPKPPIQTQKLSDKKPLVENYSLNKYLGAM